MAKNITYFDREHTGGINLAAMEDTQLKENLVQDVAAGGNEAPTATAVKEAVDVKLDKADVVNDLTTGGVDKALSAEQGKVLEGKKVDKLTDSNDLVYVHGADGTEQGKALSEFVVDTDIINDLTTGGTDKVLSAEQGKVLEDKKVDKVDTPDSVYVTEGSKPLAEFVVDTDIVNDRTTGGTDKVLAAEVGKDIPAYFELSFTADNYPLTAATIDSAKFTDNVMSTSTLYIHPDEIPADIKSKLKKGDIISTLVANPIISCKAIFERVGTTESVINATSSVVNTSLPAAGNWEGWYAFDVIASVYDREAASSKTNAYVTYLFDGDETLETLPDANGPIPAGGFAYSLVFIKPEDIKANRYINGPTSDLKQVDGSTIKPGDILCIDAPSTAEATKKIKGIQCLISRTAGTADKQLGTHVMNTKLPAAGNWGGWLCGRILSSGWDREALLAKTDSTKMQHYDVLVSNTSKTFTSMPNINGFNSDKGMAVSSFFIHPDDIADIKDKLKLGDIIMFGHVDGSAGKSVGHVNAIYMTTFEGGAYDSTVVLNETDPDGNNFRGWYQFLTLSTAYDRDQIGNKVSQYDTTAKMISDDTTPETAATLAGCDVTNASNKAVSYVYVKPEELGITEYKPGASVVVNISAALAKQQVTIEGWLGAKVTDGSALFDGLALNTKFPASGNWNGFSKLYIRNIDTNAAVINTKSRAWNVTVRATDTQFSDTWTASKTDVIEDTACPMFNFMLTKDMMSQIPNAKVGDTVYIFGPKAATKLPYDLYLYGKLHSLTAIPSTQSPVFYPLQDNSGDISGCGTLQVVTSNTLAALVQRKPNFWTMNITFDGSNIPYGMKSMNTIAFAPSVDTARFADALKEGDLIQASGDGVIRYILQFARFATQADLGNIRGIIVGQITEPADVTGYLICNIISSIYDKANSIRFGTERYKAAQIALNTTYSINIKPSEGYDTLDIGEEGIDATIADELDNFIRMSFDVGTIFELFNPSTTQKAILRVEANTYATDNRIVVMCIAKGSTNIVRL